MADLNKVFLMGRLTFDPELRRTPSGTAVTELRLATTRTWPGRDGERREETLFIDVTVWDRQAENCCQYLRKEARSTSKARSRWIPGTTRPPARSGRRSWSMPTGFSSSTRREATRRRGWRRRFRRPLAARPGAKRARAAERLERAAREPRTSAAPGAVRRRARPVAEATSTRRRYSILTRPTD